MIKVKEFAQECLERFTMRSGTNAKNNETLRK